MHSSFLLLSLSRGTQASKSDLLDSFSDHGVTNPKASDTELVENHRWNRIEVGLLVGVTETNYAKS